MFADVSCPFAYVSFVRLIARQGSVAELAPRLRVKAWPLELVNGSALSGPSLVPKIEALRQDVAPDLFTGFEPSCFPGSTLNALAAEHVAHATDPTVGLGVSLELRRRLFEDGADLSDPEVVGQVLDRVGLRPPQEVDRAAVERDHHEGLERGVQGSPHYFTAHDDFFCPTLDISHDETGYDIGFDQAGFDHFVSVAFP